MMKSNVYQVVERVDEMDDFGLMFEAAGCVALWTTPVLGVDGKECRLDFSWHSVEIVVLLIVVVQSFQDSQLIHDSHFHYSTMHFGVNSIPVRFPSDRKGSIPNCVLSSETTLPTWFNVEIMHLAWILERIASSGSSRKQSWIESMASSLALTYASTCPVPLPLREQQTLRGPQEHPIEQHQSGSQLRGVC